MASPLQISGASVTSRVTSPLLVPRVSRPETRRTTWVAQKCDEIVGFVTRGRGVSVHRADCANAASLASRSRERLIEVEWDHRSSSVFVATIEVVAIDRSRLLTDVTKVVSEHHLNIVSANTQTDSDRISRMRFDVELADPAHLESVLNLIRHLDAVYDVYRILPGKKD